MRPLLMYLLLFGCFSGKLGQPTANFPLSDCDTGQFDVLVQQITAYSDSSLRIPYDNSLELFRDIWSEGKEKAPSRVRLNSLEFTRGGQDYTCESKLITYDDQVLNICNEMNFIADLKLTSETLPEDLELKMKIATGILLDMDLGRKDSTLIVIIIIKSLLLKDLTKEDIEKSLAILQKDDTGIKFFIIINSHPNDDFVYLKNLIIHENAVNFSPLALCKKCPNGWLSFIPQETMKASSCYEVQLTHLPFSWIEASGRCSNTPGYPSTIETREELSFLQEHLFMHLSGIIKYWLNDEALSRQSAEVYIGLRRDSKSIAKRFEWEHPYGSRPLVINHWLPGQPTGGASQSCGVWVFNDIFNYTTSAGVRIGNDNPFRTLFLDYKSKSSEGWASVGCGTKLNLFTLCEMSLPREVKYNVTFRTVPTSQASFYNVLKRSEFMNYKETIVSVPAYVSNGEFRKFLTANNEEFPVFDCGEDASEPRYISYSFICDCVNHCSNRKDEITCSELDYFKCRSGQCIARNGRCNIIKDCDDGSDEEDCYICYGIRCCDGTCLPSHLFNDLEIDCTECKTTYNLTIHDESSFVRMDYDSNTFNETCAFTCNGHSCIYPSTMKKDNTYCTSPPPLLKTLSKIESANYCYNKVGYSIWSPRCVYIKDIYEAVLGCRDLSHLQNCSDFPCQEGFYKCPDSYCIPIHYILDKKSDCPEGEEEHYIENYNCTGNFACWSSRVCLHPDLVCDKHPDCPHKDDELNCNASCESGLRCIAGTVVVNNSTLFQSNIFIFPYKNTAYVDLSGLDLSNVSGSETNCSRTLYEIRLSRCGLSVDKFPIGKYCMTNVNLIDLSFNNFTFVNKIVFPFNNFYHMRELNLSFNFNLKQFVDLTLKWLIVLDLSHTGLTDIEKNIFYDLPNLKHLNLSHTKLSQFCVYISPPGFTLQTLDLRGAPLVWFFKQTFSSLTISSSLHSDNFAMCCPQIRGNSILGDLCHASENPISSCFDLISVNIQRILLWVTAGIAILGNIVVILYRLIWDKNVLKLAYGLFVVNLGISDLIMGLYLLMIAVADLYYRGVYVMYDKEWRESVVCKIAGFFATLSSETSTFFIFLITVDRFLALRFPYGQVKFTQKTKTVTICLSWSFGFILAFLPTLSVFGNQSLFSSNAVCVGLPLTNMRSQGWGYSFCVFIALNFIMFFVIAVGQVAILSSMSANRMSKEATSQNSVRRAQDITVAKQLSLVVLSDFLCWFPIGVMGFLSLSGHEISNDVYTWTVVLVLPVNSAINPLLYTIPVLMAKWEKFKFRYSRSP